VAEVKWTVTLKLPDGPDINESGTLDVESFARRDVKVNQAKWETRDLTDAGNPLHLLLVKAAPSTGKVVFRVDGGTANQPGDPLYPPLLLLGSGAGQLLDGKTLAFKAGEAAPVTVQVMTGRNPA
jgi:hypothetical protein